jgi:hypothetical protein
VRDLGDYAGRPVPFIREVLKGNPTPDQEAIASATHAPPYKSLVTSGHSVGKTCLASWLLLHSYYTRRGVTYSTAPKYEHVKDILWKEVRRWRASAGLPDHFVGDSAPELRWPGRADHFAKGVTANKGGSFQGQHEGWLAFFFDECIDVDPIYWEATKTMHKGDGNQVWLAIGNPTDTTTAAYTEYQLCDQGGNPSWARFRLSSLDHPNIAAELRGEAPPVPNAVSVSQVAQWVNDWCEPVDARDKVATDVEWPPASGGWHRPGPLFQARALGLWPELGSGVWSDALWAACFGAAPAWPPAPVLPQLGIDTATGKGEDHAGFHGRWGKRSHLHESSNTMDPVRLFGRAKELCSDLAALATSHRDPKAAPVRPQQILVKIDDDGTGGALAAFLRRDGYQVVTVGAGARAAREDLYPAKRSELWFQGAAKAKAGLVYLGGIRDKAALRRLRQQLMAAAWDMDVSGRREVEPKDDTKKKIGRSPDDADCFNLAYYDGGDFKAPPVVDTPERRPGPGDEDAGERRGRMGPFRAR